MTSAWRKRAEVWVLYKLLIIIWQKKSLQSWQDCPIKIDQYIKKGSNWISEFQNLKQKVTYVKSAVCGKLLLLVSTAQIHEEILALLSMNMNKTGWGTVRRTLRAERDRLTLTNLCWEIWRAMTASVFWLALKVQNVHFHSLSLLHTKNILIQTN